MNIREGGSTDRQTLRQTADEDKHEYRTNHDSLNLPQWMNAFRKQLRARWRLGAARYMVVLVSKILEL